MKKLLEKYVIVHYIARLFVKTLSVTLGILTALFIILEVTGLYKLIETALDLKYNSPFVTVPLGVFAVLTAGCLLVGFRWYFYKYRRIKTWSAFRKAFSGVLDDKTG